MELSGVTIPRVAQALVHDPKARTLTIQDLPVPAPRGSSPEHLLRVHAVALTNGELAWPEPAAVARPIPGYEVAGVVVSAPGGSPFQPGAEVYARTAFECPGNAREYSIATTAELGRKPSTLSWEEAATVPLSALTAWQALFVHGGFTAPGDGDGDANAKKRLLVTAASGGVGIFAVQLARWAGVGNVVGTCGPANVGFVKALGADEVLNYRVFGNLAKWGGEKFDLVIDCVGGETLSQAWTCVKDGGSLIGIAMPPDLKKPTQVVAGTVHSIFFIVEADGKQLERVTELIEAGKLQTAFDSAFPLGNYDEAFAKVNGGHARGKVVLQLA